MEKLITGIHLPAALCSIFEEAEKHVFISCPFIELHHHFKRSLKKQMINDKVRITVLYGKFSNTSHYKLLDEDSEFLRSFPNIVIYYHSRLHAKFYANEKRGLITSLNMNHSSHNNNLEYGIVVDMQTNEIAKNLLGFMHDILSESEKIFENNPQMTMPVKTIPAPRLETIKEVFPQAYEKWTPQNDQKLEQLFREKKSLDEIARIFQRQPGAIRARIIKLELYDKYGM